MNFSEACSGSLFDTDDTDLHWILLLIISKMNQQSM